jgi:hypothetical protein
MNQRKWRRREWKGRPYKGIMMGRDAEVKMGRWEGNDAVFLFHLSVE